MTFFLGMITRRWFLQISLCLLFAFTAFGEVPIDQSDYLPMNEGDEWTMDAKIVSPKGEVTNATAKRRVGEQVEKDGKVYRRTRTWMEGGPMPFDMTKLTRKDEKGFYSIDERNKDAKEDIEVVLPMKIGESWKKPIGKETATDTVIGVESVTVNGKTYENCIHIRSTTTDGGFTEDYWEAPKVGSVKSEMTYSSGGKIILTIREFKSGK